MTLNEAIYHRKSVRSYSGDPVDADTLRKIKAFSCELKPLYPEIAVRSEIVDRDSVKCMLPWITPQLIAIYSEDKPGYLENVGFMFQQMDLYLQSIGLGACWLGMGRMRAQADKAADGMKFVMLIAFGIPKGKATRSGAEEFKRKALNEISDREDSRLEPARLAPSSINSQPWYFTHEGSVLHIYCVQQGFLKAKTIGYMNAIDVGIALAQLCVANPDSFRFFRAENPALMKGYAYIGSFEI